MAVTDLKTISRAAAAGRVRIQFRTTRPNVARIVANGEEIGTVSAENHDIGLHLQERRYFVRIDGHGIVAIPNAADAVKPAIADWFDYYNQYADIWARMRYDA